MKKPFLIFALILIPALLSAATLRWSAVESTSTCTIKGYTVSFWEGDEKPATVKYHYNTAGLQVADIVATFHLAPNVEYSFSVCANSTSGEIGPYSAPIKWTYKPAPPPDDNLPPAVIYIPGKVQTIIIGNQE